MMSPLAQSNNRKTPQSQFYYKISKPETVNFVLNADSHVSVSRAIVAVMTSGDGGGCIKIKRVAEITKLSWGRLLVNCTTKRGKTWWPPRTWNSLFPIVGMKMNKGLDPR